MSRAWMKAALALMSIAAMACSVDARDDYLGDKDPKQFAIGHAAAPAQVAALDILVFQTHGIAVEVSLAERYDAGVAAGLHEAVDRLGLVPQRLKRLGVEIKAELQSCRDSGQAGVVCLPDLAEAADAEQLFQCPVATAGPIAAKTSSMIRVSRPRIERAMTHSPLVLPVPG